ncbi:hypothetical protein, partial [Klebsiella pneumoniae]|uniref:hypothetical protein n=1 Tax=Klebsiella pneumoniae TaxID=573 RepID=UPI001C8F68D0
DEVNGPIIKELVSLMPKMYALKFKPILQDEEDSSQDEDVSTGDEEEKNVIKKAKGIKSAYLKKKIKFENYLDCLKNNKTYKATYNTIRSYNHQIFSITEEKKSLSTYDDKRKHLTNGINTLPYGHYLLT